MYAFQRISAGLVLFLGICLSQYCDPGPAFWLTGSALLLRKQIVKKRKEKKEGGG
jgi:hypothetical protein